MKAFLIASDKKLVSVPVGDLTRIRQFEACGLAGVLGFGLLPTIVHSWGVAFWGIAFLGFAFGVLHYSHWLRQRRWQRMREVYWGCWLG